MCFLLNGLSCHLCRFIRPNLPIDVFYDSKRVDYYVAEILVEDVIIIEVKASVCLAEANEAPLLNYLKATPNEVALLLNFGKQPQFKEKYFF